MTSISAFFLVQTEQWSHHPCSYNRVSLSQPPSLVLSPEPQPSSPSPPLLSAPLLSFPPSAPLPSSSSLPRPSLLLSSLVIHSSTSPSIPEAPSCLSMFSFFFFSPSSLLFNQPSRLDPSTSQHFFCFTRRSFKTFCTAVFRMTGQLTV